MDRRLVLALLLLALCAFATGGGLWRARVLQQLSADGGPHTLLRDGQGGFFLATDTILLHLDGQGALRDRHDAAQLGIAAFDALATGEDRTLWVQDRRQRRLFRCDTSTWTCQPAGEATALLGARLELAWLYGRDRRLLAADSAGQRLLTFDAGGHPLPLPAQPWRAPQQLSTAGGEVLLAEGGAQRIVSIDPVANQAGAPALMTQSAPRRFLHRDNRWWVLEGSAPWRLRHYQDGIGSDITLSAQDPVALLDGGRSGLLLASRADWRLLALDPETGDAIAFGSPPLQQELLTRARARREAQAALAQLPWIVLPLVAVTALPVPLLLWQRRRARRHGAVASIRSNAGSRAGSSTRASARPSTSAGVAVPTAATVTTPRHGARTETGRVSRIDTRPDLLVEERARQDRHFRWLLWSTGLLLAIAGPVFVLWPPLRDNGSAWAITGFIAIVPLFLRGQLIASRRQEDRLYDRHLVCGPDKVVVVAGGKPVTAVAYQAVWLGEQSLVVGPLRLPLYQGRGATRRPVWDIDALEATLAPRLPADHRLPEGTLGRTLLAQGQWRGLLILVQALPYPLAIPLILLLLLECWRWLAPGISIPPAP